MGIAKALAFAIAMNAAPGAAMAASDPVQTSQTGIPDTVEQDINNAAAHLARALKELGISPSDSNALDIIHNATQSLVDGDSGRQDSGE